MEKRTTHSAIEEKMATMRLKNLELLKRHQEIEEDRQLAQQINVQSNVMQNPKKSRNKGKARAIQRTDFSTQDNSNERFQQRGPTNRRKNEPNDHINSNRLKRERVRDVATTDHQSHRPELIQYAYPFHHQTDHRQDTDGPAQAKKLVVVNNQADRIGSGRFRQPQGQRKREERTHRTTNTTETMNRKNEFHLDVPPMNMWTNNSPIVPLHVQLLPTNLNGPVEHHLINSHPEQTLPNFLYQTATPHTSFNNNGTIYFAPRPNLPPSAPPPTGPTYFPSFQPARTIDNSTFHPHHGLPTFSSGNVFQPTTHYFPPPNLHPYPEENPSIVNNFRPLRITPERDLKKSNYRYQRNQTTNSLPLSAYMNTDESEHSSHQKRRTTQHQFPLSSYDPRQYGFHRRGNHRRSMNNNTRTNDVDLIEEWWEDDNAELIGTTVKTNDDSGHSSLSTSTICENQQSKLNDSNRSSTDESSTTDKQILHSLDRLQQELKFEEAIDECLTSEQVDSIKQSGTYNTAHFLQWAKKMFREELAGRLTAQEIQHHDAVTRDDDKQPLGDKLDALRDDLQEKLNIENDDNPPTND